MLPRVAVALMLASMMGCASAPTEQGPRLVPRYMVAPNYPEDLRPTGIAGSVKVQFDVEASGEVTHVRILDAGHPAFAKVAEERVKFWRFQPWTPTAEYPAPRTASRTLYFDPKSVESGIDAVPATETEKAAVSMERTIHALVGQPCSAINREVAAFRQASPDKPMDEMDTFKLTGGAVFLASLSGKMGVEEAQIMNRRFDAALPRVVERCQQQPEAVYGKVLGEEMRRARVDSARS